MSGATVEVYPASIDVPLSPTEGEILWLWRKRHRWSVDQAATALNVKRLVYIEAEHDRCPLPARRPRLVPSQAERLRLFRRRSQLARGDVARCLGVSHVTFLKWERAVHPNVVRLWCDGVPKPKT